MKIAILGVGYLALQVLVMKVVVVLLAQLNQWLEPFSPLVVALAFTLVGTSMFLCPFIPGPPIYVCSGVLLPYAMMSADERAATRGAAPLTLTLTPNANPNP